MTERVGLATVFRVIVVYLELHEVATLNVSVVLT